MKKLIKPRKSHIYVFLTTIWFFQFLSHLVTMAKLNPKLNLE